MLKSGNKKRLLSVVLLAGALMMTGCGEEPYELQDNERAIIVNYAAHMIAKYNVKQPEGYRFVPPVVEEAADEEENPTQETQTEEEDEQKDEHQDEQTQGEADAGESEASGDEQSPVTLTEALGLKDVQAVYTGAELTDRYDTVIPESGKKLLIVHVTLQNRTKKAAACDILSQLPVFRATLNGMPAVTAELAIFPENLSTWEEEIPAGGSEDTVIMFQVNGDAKATVDQLEMEVTAGKNTSKVVFL